MLKNSYIYIDEYLKELDLLSDEIIKLYEEIDKLIGDEIIKQKNPKNLPPYIHLSTVFPKLQSILLHSANIKKIITHVPKRKKETKASYTFRFNRYNELIKHYNPAFLNNITNISLRNALEHYDEYLDNTFKKLENSQIPKNKNEILTNMIISSEKKVDVEKLIYLKCFVLDTKTYKVGSKEAYIEEIYKEAKYIHKQTKNALGERLSPASTLISVQDQHKK